MQVSEVVSYSINTKKFTVGSTGENDMEFETFSALLSYYTLMGLQLTTAIPIETYTVGSVYVFVFTEVGGRLAEVVPDMSLLVSNN